MNITIYDKQKIGSIRKLGNGIFGLRGSSRNDVSFEQLSHYVYVDKKGSLMTWKSKNKDAMEKLEDLDFDTVLVKLSPSV